MKFLFCSISRSLMAIYALFLVSSIALAKKASPSLSSSTSSKSADRDFVFTMPLAADRQQLRPHFEFNLGGEAGLAIEAGLIGEAEELGSKEVEETGNSLKVKGAQATLLIARYSEPQSLSGFFWSLGGGYRQYNAEWKKKPEDADKEPRMSMTDDDGYLHHRVVGSGVVGVARVGYRFIPAEWPIALGAHIGMRHMNSTVKDVEVDDDEQEKLNLEYSKINEKERKSIKNRMMTQPDFAIEFGFSF